MSRRDVDLDDLIDSAQLREAPRRWHAQRAIFGRLGLGSSSALLLARLAHAFSSVNLPRLIFGGAGLALVAGGIFAAARFGAGAPVRAERLSDAVGAPSSALTSPAPPSGAEPAMSAVSIDSLPSAPAPSAKTTRPAERGGPVASGDDLVRETASISAIRSKIAAREYASALAAVRLHRRSFPRGALTQEASVLEIEALEGLGDDARMCAVGKAFLDAHPTSAHRARVLGLLRSCNQ